MLDSALSFSVPCNKLMLIPRYPELSDCSRGKRGSEINHWGAGGFSLTLGLMLS